MEHQNHRCDRNDCENYIPQVCDWDVFEVAFHVGSSLTIADRDEKVAIIPAR
jgi:hypothetical protein